MKTLDEISKTINPKIKGIEFKIYEETLKVKDYKNAIRVLNRAKDQFSDDSQLVSRVEHRLIAFEKDLYLSLKELEELETRLKMLTA